jgi:branched-chain amino acid aminotransferase
LSFINVNGKIIASTGETIPVDNGAFRYGYGLFETMLVQDGAIRLIEYHWKRFYAGLQQLQLHLPAFMTPDWLEGRVLTTVRKNNLQHLCRVRLQAYANCGGLYEQGNEPAGLLIECFGITPETIQLNDNGLVVGIAKDLYKSPDALANLKSCNALIYAIAAQQAKANRWNDALVRNTAGDIIESTIANIFWAKNGVIYTPPLTDGCIAGVMRQYLTARIPIIEKTLHVAELLTADEIFLTNAVKRIKWIGSIESKKYPNKLIKQVCNECLT